MEREKKLRLGDRYKPTETTKALSPEEKITTAIQQLVTAHPEDLFPGLAKTCLSTIHIYISKAFIRKYF